MTQREIVFVYNADGTWTGKVKDAVHKIVRPSTYACQLCAVTYGFAGMKRQWRDFVTSLDATVSFLHRDELTDDHASIAGELLPAVWHRNDAGSWQPLITATEMRDFATLHELIDAMSVTLRAPSPS